MAEGGSSEVALGAVGGQENADDFDTPPESPDDLRIELSPEVQAELDELETTEDFITKNQESIARSAESVRELQATMEKLMGHTSARKAELANRTQKIKDMKREIEEISTEDIAKEEEALQRLAEMVKSSAATTNGTASGDGKKNDTNGELLKVDQLTELKLKIEAYKDHLGLECNVIDDNVEFVFSDIDAQSPDTLYSIKLCVDGEDYKCISCEPPMKNTEPLFKQLNSHHDFQKFITSIRSEFQNLANKEN